MSVVLHGCGLWVFSHTHVKVILDESWLWVYLSKSCIRWVTNHWSVRLCVASKVYKKLIPDFEVFVAISTLWKHSNWWSNGPWNERNYALKCKSSWNIRLLNLPQTNGGSQLHLKSLTFFLVTFTYDFDLWTWLLLQWPLISFSNSDLDPVALT